MRVYEAKIVYSLVSLGEEVRLDRPEMVADYLRSAFDECPMQEAFYCVYLDRKNHPIGRHLVTLGTATSTLVAPVKSSGAPSSPVPRPSWLPTTIPPATRLPAPLTSR